MKAALLPISALLLSVVFLLAANGLLGVLLPVRALLQEYSSFDIGILGAAYYGGFGAGCLSGPWLVKRVGHIRTFAAMAAVYGSLCLTFSVLDSTLVWWLARTGTGFSVAVLFIVIESWLNERSTNENRGLIFSVYTAINLTVITVGQMILTMASPKEFLLFALAAILVSLSMVPIALSTAVAPAPLKSIRIRLGYLFERSPVGVVGSLGVGLTNGAFWTMGPIFIQQDSGNASGPAIFMSIAVLAGALGQWPLGKLSDRVDRRRVIIGACVGAMLGAVFLVVASHFLPGTLYLGAIFFGCFSFPVYALCAAHLNDFVEPDGYVEAISGLLIVFAVGAILGPLIASGLMRIQGPGGLFMFTAFVHVGIAAYAFYRCQRRDSPLEEERAQFVDTLVMTEIAAEIDPRPGEQSQPADTEDMISNSDEEGG